nr:bifunctional UDP-sugar hydrolase/5'-nucleotidase [Chromobacterium sp. ASV5]
MKLLPLFLLALPLSALADTVDVTILGTSDLHGRFVPWDYASDTENRAGSLAQIASQIAKVRAEQRNVILVDAGDTIQGNFVENFKHEPVSPMMLGFNALKYDVWVPGNHEFDFGLPVLATSLKQFQGKALGGNIREQDGSPFLPATAIVERQGVKIGVIGMDTPMTAVFAKNSNRLGTLQFTNPVLEVKKAVQALSGKVDALVLVAHMGIDNENDMPGSGVGDIARANPELDAIVAGHMHVKVDKAVINGVIVTEPDKYGQALSRIDLKFEQKDGKYTLVDKNSFTYPMAKVASDKQLEAIYQPYHQKLRAFANRRVATLSGVDLVPRDAVRGIPQVHVQDSGISALFQEASFHYAPMANVIALQIDNDKARLDVGEIRAKDIAYNYQYAGGEISVYELNGKALKQYMEWSAGYFNQLKDGDVTISFDAQRRASKYSTNDFFAGVRYRIDLTQPAGERIRDLTFANGKPIVDATPIRLGMNAYRMGHLTKPGAIFAGQRFPMVFSTEKKFGEEQGTIRNLTIRYLSEVKKGRYVGKPQQRWQLVGLKGYERERAIVEGLLNRGEISVPMSADGRFSNVASINVKDKVFASKADYLQRLTTLEQQLATAGDEAQRVALKRDLALVKALNAQL